MNEPSDKNSTDAEFFNRLMKAIQGEASELEKQEVDRRCEEDAEFAIMKREFETVHRLMEGIGKEESITNQSDWKLPNDKRNQLLAAMDGLPTQPPIPSLNQQTLEKIATREHLVRNILVIVATLLLVYLALAYRVVVNEQANRSAKESKEQDWFDREYTPADSSNRLDTFRSFSEGMNANPGSQPEPESPSEDASAIQEQIVDLEEQLFEAPSASEFLDIAGQQQPQQSQQQAAQTATLEKAEQGRPRQLERESLGGELAKRLKKSQLPEEEAELDGDSMDGDSMDGAQLYGLEIDELSRDVQAEGMGGFGGGGFGGRGLGIPQTTNPTPRFAENATISNGVAADQKLDLPSISEFEQSDRASSRSRRRIEGQQFKDGIAKFSKEQSTIDAETEKLNRQLDFASPRVSGQASSPAAGKSLGNSNLQPGLVAGLTDQSIQLGSNQFGYRESSGAMENNQALDDGQIAIADADGITIQGLPEPPASGETKRGEDFFKEPGVFSGGRTTRDTPLIVAGKSPPADRFEKTAETRSLGKKLFSAINLSESTAQQQAFSTFSLHINDVSFKLARAALQGGQWPKAETIRIEEFVNALDYGDPTPGKFEKVACRVEQSSHPFLQQRNLMRIGIRTAAAGRSGETPLRLTLLVDNSGSMERIDRRQTVRRAFETLAQQLQPMDQVSLISFSRQPRLLADRISGDQSDQLVEMIANLPSEGGTNIESALQLAFEKAREQYAENAQNRVVLLTDGAVNLGNANPETLSQMITNMRSAGVAFDAAGISADGLNDTILEALTRKGDGRYYLLDSFESADERFASQIAGALRPAAKNVKVQVEFNPKRVGRYLLLGFEKHRLKKEDFRDDKVDAAEMAAEEAGVAIYHFEAKPDGEGDIGSVSVRFRDLSSGQMIENRWPIPYLADAPRFDQAAPSLQIASIAALLAVKLKGESLADTIDLTTLSNLMSGLPDRDRQASRVQELQQMIQRARQLSE